ncbi:MAG: cobyrinate a,c-diamide synthase [Planctomycetes bacterium]|nr:cobyrinate a,c-diamide synthase [Planctomycetota bacterium]
MVPRLVIAGTRSGVGKTSLALGIMAALKSRGLRVQPFKVGPDYLDPTWHRLATGRVSYNLDTWMLSREYVKRLFQQKTADADIAIIEGVMGLFDGASTTGLQGSTAEIASLLNAPILLVADASGAGRSFAAGIKGFSEFEPGCCVAAVIANYCGSSRHATMLQEALTGAGLCKLAGWFSRDAFPELPSRHLGLQAPQSNAPGQSVIEAIGLAVQQQLDMDAIYRLAGQDSIATSASNVLAKLRPDPVCRGTLAVAMDEAFSFYYADNLELLRSCGLRIVEFSPLHDAELPPGIDGLYLGGGYPEEHAQQLSANSSMRESIARFAETDRPVYAECGGMMYLARTVVDRDGQTWQMAGLLPFSTRMLTRSKRLGYVSTTMTEQTLFGPPGTVLRGHEYHYSEIVEPFEFGSWRQPYLLRDSRGGGERSGGFAQGNILASYVHQHFQSNPLAAETLAEALNGA